MSIYLQNSETARSIHKKLLKFMRLEFPMKFSRREDIVKIAISLLIWFMLATGTIQISRSSAQGTRSFAFFAGGDIGATSATAQTFRVMRNSGSAFMLALGDLSYEDAGDEPTDGVTPSPWCNWVKRRLGATYPVQLLVGNHEDDDHIDGFIDNFTTCLPDRMNSVGRYGIQYYFDYPRNNPLMRVIMIAPDMDYRGDIKYEVGTSYYRWLVRAIDDARARNIPWITVAMHKNCLTMGNKSCEIGSELLDLLVRKRVDLVLQGHDHDYQRSKQLRLRPGCSSIAIDRYDADCVIDDGQDRLYTRGRGTVIVIAGMLGGGGLTDLDCRDPERFYFARAMGSETMWNGNRCREIGAGRGIVRYVVTRDRIDARFMMSVQTHEGTRFTDRFSIVRPS